MQPCIASIWQAGADEPNAVRQALDQQLALDCDLFGVKDKSVSRFTNAPKLTSLSSRRVRLVVPAECATGAVVIQRMDFDALQRRISSGHSGYPRVHAAELGRRSLVARGAHSALGLLLGSSADAARPDQLVALPHLVQLEGAVDVQLEAPAIVIVGSGAVAVHPGITVFPDSGAHIVDPTQRFRLPQTGILCGIDAAVAAMEKEEDSTLIRVAGHDSAVRVCDLPRVARALLGRLDRRSFFVPALLHDREPRLCLLYQGRDGRHAGIVSTPDVEAWLAHLHAYRTAEPSAPKSTTPPARAPERSERAPIDASTKPATLEPSPFEPGSLEPPALDPSALEPPLAEPVRLGSLETRYARFGKALNHLQRALDTNFSILLLGETGTGKEHLARELHAQSTRAQARFYSVNVSALPEALVETELFGHAKGAFTGTHEARPGAFVSADGGTLLLDEIADAPLKVQVALLSVLETRCVRAVGSDRERKVDVRVIAATSRDLPALIAQGRFRADLYYRLADLSVTVPALRHRPDDIPAIARTVLRSIDPHLTLSDDALSVLSRQTWPGNIRTLRSSLRRAALLTVGHSVIGTEQLSELGLVETQGASAVPVDFSADVRETGEALWQRQALPPMWASRYERRAAHRAALIYLAVQRGKHAFPAALKAQWELLFRKRWATTENQRGLRELLQRFGASLRDEGVRGWVLHLVGT